MIIPVGKPKTHIDSCIFIQNYVYLCSFYTEYNQNQKRNYE